MKKFISIFTVLMLVVVTAQAQKVWGPSKCPTCGKPVATCQYHGRHPKPDPTPTEKKCATCGKLVSKCQYKGNHPKCATCGKLMDACEYHGNHPKQTSGSINGHDWVDLGLSVKWATCNVGANRPEDYGGYYAWGETRTKSSYDWDNCFDCLSDEGDSWSVYKMGGKTRIEPNSGHDTARVNWGGTWRMPSIKELDELASKCKWNPTSKGGRNGYVVTGPNGNSIFLPAAGMCVGASLFSVGEWVNLWSNSLDDEDPSDIRSDGAVCLIAGGEENDHYVFAGVRRGGFSVRPVTE